MDTKTLKSTSLKIVLSMVLSPLSSPMQDLTKTIWNFVFATLGTYREESERQKRAKRTEVRAILHNKELSINIVFAFASAKTELMQSSLVVFSS